MGIMTKLINGTILPHSNTNPTTHPAKPNIEVPLELSPAPVAILTIIIIITIVMYWITQVEGSDASFKFT